MGIQKQTKIEPLHPNAPWFFKLESGAIIDLNRVYAVITDKGYRALISLESTATDATLSKNDYDRLCEIEAAMNEMVLHFNVTPEELKKVRNDQK